MCVVCFYLYVYLRIYTNLWKLKKEFVACVFNPHLGLLLFSITLQKTLTICLVARDERKIYLQSAPFPKNQLSCL